MGIKRKPLVAILLSMFSPGLGHIYCGRLRMAIWLAVTGLIIGNVLFYLMVYWEAAPFNIILPLAGIVTWLVFVTSHAYQLAKQKSLEFKPRFYNRWYYYLLYWLFLVLLSWPFLPIFGSYDGYKIAASSMENVLFPGDRLIAGVGTYEPFIPSSGDVVIFIFPGDGVTKYVMRCVAESGDTVQIIDKILYINGSLAVEKSTVKFIDTTSSGQQRIIPRGSEGRDSRYNFGPYVVPQRSYFMLGDSRDNSFDSRYWGAVHEESILGKAIRITYSSNYDRIGKRIE